jgi:radical SAM protein with 4Fe4S-binding SPASM domain
MVNITRFLKEVSKNPRKVFNVVGMKIMSRFEPRKMYFYPSFLAIEPTINCNLDCVMCQKNTLRRTKRELEFDDFKRIIDKMPFLRVLNLQGIGEPFLNKDFFKMIEYAHSKGIRVYTFSNANLITKKIAKQIIHSSLMELIVSIDGANKQTYEKIRRQASFDKLLNNLKYLFSIRESKKLKISAWVVPNIYNMEEIEEIVKLCNKIGFDEIVIQSKLSVYSYKKEVYSTNKRINVNNNPLFKSRLLKIKNSHPNVRICDDVELSTHNKCRWPWTSMFISSDGYIIPCCVISDPNVANFGNILEKGFREIWNSKEYQQFRKDIRDNKVPFYCLDCYSKI